MKEHVKHFISHCPFCQKMNLLKTSIHTVPFTTATYTAHERQNWDSVGPITLSNEETIHILVAIDCFTRWVELWKTNDVSVDSVRLPMLQHFGRYGPPHQILTDNGSQFVNKTLEELTNMTGFEHITTLPYSKEENSIVERANREVMRHIRAFIYEYNEDTNIEELLPSVMRIMNTNVHESVGTSPANLMFGYTVNLDRGIFLPEKALSKVNISLSHWAARMLKEQQRLLKTAEKLQRAKDAANIAKRTKTNPNELKVGSFVLVRYISSILRKGPPRKTNTNLRGPYKVLKVKLNIVTIYNSITRKAEDIHLDNCYPFTYDPQYVDPEDVARRVEISAFAVESITQHAGDKKKRSTMEFLVRFVGFDESEDRWLPYSELRDNPALHRYLRANRMKSLIPLEHKNVQKEE